MSDQQTEFQASLDHLVRLAGKPGWKGYAWHRAQQMEIEYPQNYKGMALALTARMKELGGVK